MSSIFDRRNKCSYNFSMDIREKVDTLERAAAFDCEGPPRNREQQKAQFLKQSRAFVTHPQRGKIPVMRTMLTSACERNCYYCPFQAGRNFQRVSLKPEELAKSFDEMQRDKPGRWPVFEQRDHWGRRKGDGRYAGHG